MRLTNKNGQLRNKIEELIKYSMDSGTKIEFDSKYIHILISPIDYTHYEKEMTIFNNNGGGYINLDLTKTHELIEDNKYITLKCKDYTIKIIKEQQ
ncbi:MAG: hypothetical protein ACRC1T_04855 [Clostridium chrysemydis]|uniref:hypothetical protein n=1 Tax=Clostridium chrysemydis TaxID=2665504 RepID=UPI003F321354